MYWKCLEFVASPAGLEPATHSLGNCCSILLSYGDCVGLGELIFSVPVIAFGRGPQFATGRRECTCISRSGGPGQPPWGTHGKSLIYPGAMILRNAAATIYISCK